MTTFLDPVAATITLLQLKINNVKCSRRRPDAHPDRPVVVINVDGGDVRYPILAEPLLRLTVWGNSEDAGPVWDLAQECLGVLLTHNGGELVGYRSPTVPAAGEDRDNGDVFATFNITARIHSTAV